MRILISGASGLVGVHLIPTLKAKGHEVFKLVRKTPKASDEIQWDADNGFAELEQEKLENFNVVIHLAGENIAGGSWTDERKKRLIESRTIGTRVLVEALKKTKNPPKVFISASAEGFYGDGKDEITGAVLSVTEIVRLHIEAFPQSSVAVQVRVKLNS